MMFYICTQVLISIVSMCILCYFDFSRIPALYNCIKFIEKSKFWYCSSLKIKSVNYVFNISKKFNIHNTKWMVRIHMCRRGKR